MYLYFSAKNIAEKTSHILTKFILNLQSWISDCT